MKICHVLSLVMVVLFAGGMAQAQDQSASTWYFGKGAGLSFLTDPPTPLTNGATTNIEGTAVICNSRTGVVLFYTDGSTVWDHNNVAKATGIGGNVSSSTQSTCIVPHPADTTIYYVFTVEDESKFPTSQGRVTQVRVQGGEVISVGTPQTICTGVAEKVTAAKACNGIDYWVIFRLRSSGFLAYSVTRANGFSAASQVASNVGVVLPTAQDGRGQMKISPDGRWIATANETIGTEVFKFNNATGQVTSPVIFAQGQQRYGLSFSPNSRYLYVNSGWKPAPQNHIYQYDVTATTIGASEVDIATIPVNVGLGSMQIGTDGKIYVARYNTQFLGAITQPNVAGTASTYVDQAVRYPAGVTVYWGLPNVPQSFFVPQLTGSDTSTCAGTGIRLGVPQKPGYVYRWSPGSMFDDSTLAQPTVTVNATTTVTLRATDPLGCDLVQTVTIKALPLPVVTTSADTTICRGTVATLRANAPNAVRIAWSPPSGLDATSGAVVHASPTATTTYTISVTDSSSCTSTRQIVVSVNPLPTPVISTADTVYGCSGTPVSLTAGTSFVRTTWSTGATTPSINVTTSGLYWIEVTDAQGCVGRDSVIVTMRSLPVITTSADTTICPGTTATLRASGGATYRWTPSSGLDDARSAQPTATPLQSTTYTVVVTSAEGCADSSRVTVNVRSAPHPSLGQADTTICACDSLLLRIPSGYVLRSWSTGSTQPVLVVRTSGSYYATIVDQFGCVGVTDTVTISTFIPTAKLLVAVTPEHARDNVPVDVVVTLMNGAELEQCLGQSTTFSLALNASILAPKSADARGTVDLNSSKRTVQIPASAFSNNVVVLHYVSTLGRVESTSVVVESASSATCAAQVDASPSMFTLDEICKAGNTRRFYMNRFAPVVIAPNPTSGAATFRYESDGETSATLDVVDVMGRTVLSTILHPSHAGVNETVLDASVVPDGLYTVRWRTENDRGTLLLGVRP